MEPKDKAKKVITESGTIDNKVARAILLANGLSIKDPSVKGAYGRAMQINRYKVSKFTSRVPAPRPAATWVTRYREMCEKFDVIPPHGLLMAITGHPNAGAFGGAKSTLEADGYAFEKAKDGYYKITARPYDKKAQRVNELKAALDKIKKELDELSK